MCNSLTGNQEVWSIAIEAVNFKITGVKHLCVMKYVIEFL
jgi:hypothetical protein